MSAVQILQLSFVSYHIHSDRKLRPFGNLASLYDRHRDFMVNNSLVSDLALQFFTTVDRVLESNPDFVDRYVGLEYARDRPMYR
jgi:hypothetical protein